MMERRLESRFLCADLVRVSWLADVDEFRTVEAVLEDISALGACVQVEERIPVGAAISISATSEAANPLRKPARFSGDVSYCAFRDYGYFVGIRFSGETKWSSAAFAPQHLTNLALLAQTGDRAPAEELLPETS